MEKIRIILKQNLTGRDLMKIAEKMDCSIAKVQMYINGKGNENSIKNEILAASLTYFCAKYKALLNEIENLQKID